MNLNYVLSPDCVRDGARKIFEETLAGNTHFNFHKENLDKTVDLVMDTMKESYPDMEIPLHSRWGHFRSGNVDRLQWLHSRIKDLTPLEQARNGDFMELKLPVFILARRG